MVAYAKTRGIFCNKGVNIFQDEAACNFFSGQVTLNVNANHSVRALVTIERNIFVIINIANFE